MCIIMIGFECDLPTIHFSVLYMVLNTLSLDFYSNYECPRAHSAQRCSVTAEELSLKRLT